ncbi:MAG: hypothetical protein Q8Q14_15530 [Gemmatimonadales bacterium]|nr:hypothetical protein [Gemmatimonadales bacterium]
MSRPLAERLARAQRIGERVSQLLLAAAQDGRTSGSLTINLGDGWVSTIEKRLVTGERDDYQFPALV